MTDTLVALATTTAAECTPCQLAAAPLPQVAGLAPDPAAPLRARWSGVLGVEGELTGDGRMIEKNALVWENLPLPLRYVPQDVGAHDGAVVVGLIDKVTRSGANILGEGDFDLESPYGPEARACVEKKTMDGVSMDLDDVSFEVRVKAELMQASEDEIIAMLMGEPAGMGPTDAQGRITVATVGSDDEVMATTSARIRAATIVAIPAFDTARIALAGAAPDAAPPSKTAPDAAPAGIMPDGTTPCSCVDGDPGYDPECECQDSTPADKPTKVPASPPPVGSPPGFVASAAPDAPPAAWFSRPTFTEPTALNVTAQGQVFGHLAAWGTCHIGHAHSGCVTAPHSAADYAYFHTGVVLTAEGAEVPAGHITLDTTHAGERLSAASAASHYENTGSVVADVACGEDSFGIWVAGSLRPTATAAQVRALRSAPLSGDWRRISGNLELVAALAVNVPGFSVPRPRGLVAGGAAQSLVASGMIPPRTVRRPGTPGALSLDDLRYLKRLADRERAEESREILGPLDAGTALARRVRASALVMRAHRPITTTHKER